jgi:hypothetical protein
MDVPDITLVRDEITWLVVLGCVTFYQLTTASKHTLLTLIVAFMFVWVGWQYLSKKSAVASEKLGNKRKVLNEDVASRNKQSTVTSTDLAGVNVKRKKELKYLFKNQELYGIAQELFFVRIFDKMLYADILMAMEHLQKEYVYILTSRYDAKNHVDIFLDVAKSVNKLMYSIYFAIPDKMKYVYGVKPHDVVERNIERFTALKRTMTQVLENFCRKEKKLPHFPVYSPAAADQPFDFMRNRELP